METLNGIYEPYRYLENAKLVLKKKAKKEGRYYIDSKYVKAAGHYAYSGILIALNDWIEIQLGQKIPKRAKGKRGVDLDFYRSFLKTRNKKMLKYYNEAYNSLHLYAGYDGSLSVGNMQDG